MSDVTGVTAYVLDRAWVDGRMRDDVLVVVDQGRFVDVRVDGSAEAATAAHATRLPGLTIPGLANAHSHAFHRALRGRAQGAGQGSFWTWREQMYAVAGRLDPDSYVALARAVFREMAAAGITTVGEFHYVHHQPSGRSYADPNAMGLALIEAALDVGVRLALLDTCYLSSGFGEPVGGAQLRFADEGADQWVERVDAMSTVPWTDAGPMAVIGAAIHSVRAVPLGQMAPLIEWAEVNGAPLHVHLSEQSAENEACVAHYGVTPTELLAEAGALGPRTSVVHATHLTDRDVELLGEAGVIACFCPTTERDLADGIGPATQLRDAGVRLTLGSDSHAVIDLFEEMRAVEMHERLANGIRGNWSTGSLLEAATATGHHSLGFGDAGRIEVGCRADLVTVNPSSIRLAGTGGDEHAVVFAASAEDVVQTMADGRVIFRAGDPVDARAEIAHELEAAIATVLADGPHD